LTSAALDWSLLALPIGGLGPHLLPVATPLGTVYLYRILVLIALLRFVGPSRNRRRGDRPAPPPYHAPHARWWLLFGALGLGWAWAPREGVLDLTSIIVGVTCASALFLGVAAGSSGRRLLSAGWTIALACTLAIAAWQVMPLRHLRSFYTVRLPSCRSLIPFAAATFDNPNDFAGVC
jgi:hypothetical protein